MSTSPTTVQLPPSRPNTPSSPPLSPGTKWPLTPAPWQQEPAKPDPPTPLESLPSSPNRFVTSTANPSPVKAVEEPSSAALTPNSSPVSDGVFKFPLPPAPLIAQATAKLNKLANEETPKPPTTPVVVINSPPKEETKGSQENDEGTSEPARAKSPSEMSSVGDSESVFGGPSSSAGAMVTPAASVNGDASSDGELMFADGTNPRYKTEVCRNFKERSKCVYGDQCQFAHGRRELREVVRNSKYKTKHCQKYWLTGYCAYGPRCNFLHNEVALEDEQFLKRRSRNSTGSSSYGMPASLNMSGISLLRSTYNDSPSLGSQGQSRSGTPTSGLLTMMPPPPLPHHHALPYLEAGWGGSSGGYKMRGYQPHSRPVSRGPSPMMRPPPPPAPMCQQQPMDIFARMGEWKGEDCALAGNEP